MFAGSLVALITPFKNGSVDEKGFEKFVAWQIKEGTDGLVPAARRASRRRSRWKSTSG